MTHSPISSSPLATSPARAGLPLLVALCAGCASVPEVESRLQSLQFHPNMYVVQAGDTLETIAFRYELAPEELAALNPASGELVPGTRINVRPGTDLPEVVRTRADTVWRGEPRDPAVAAAPTEPSTIASPRSPSAPQPALTTAITRAVPRTVIAESLPADASAADAVVGADERGYAREPTRHGESAYPREEVLPDDFDIDRPGAARGALDGELQRYVGRWSWPTEGAVARGFAPERIGGQGVDIAGVPGQDVRAALDGTVVYSGRDLGGGGNLVIVRHDDDLMTTYAHADELYVAEDDRVRAGDAIASLGWNERRESVLGFEVRRGGDPLDPMAFLPPR